MGFRGSRSVDRGPRTMHKSVCAECGKRCEVPFRPTGDRPVYCLECWDKRRPPRTEGRRPREDRQRRPPRTEGRRPREDRQRRTSPAPENISLQILDELKRIRKALEKETS